MNNTLMNFDFKSNRVRVLNIKEEPWFVAKDVALVLDYKKVDKMLNHVDSEDKQIVNPQKLDSSKLEESFGANTFKVSVINESGLYACIFGSEKPEAKVFKKWVTSEVLPEIRKTGGYNLQEKFDIPQDYASALRLAADEYERRLQAEENAKQTQGKLNEAEDVLDTYRAILSPESCLTVAEVAKALGVKNLGRNNLFSYLRRKDFIQQKPSVEPYQNRIDQELAVVDLITINKGSKQDTTPQTKLTFKGLEWLIKKLIADNYPVNTTAKAVWDHYNGQQGQQHQQT